MRSLSPERQVKGVGAPVALDVDFGTAFELVLGLRTFVDREEDRESYRVGHEWFDRVRSVLSPETLHAIDAYAGGHEMLFGYLLALAAETPEPRDAAALLETIDALPALELRRLLLGHRLETYRGGVPRETIAAAADGDTDAADALLAGCLDWQREPYAHVLGIGADDLKRLLAIALRGWHAAVLAPDEEATARRLKQSAIAARRLAARASATEVIDIATRGIRYLPEPGIRRVLLVPQIVSRPWTIFNEAGDTKIMCYGLLDAGLGDDAPPERLAQAFKALGDETRLRLLRRLAEGPATLQQLTELTALAKSTVHGHLLVLRTGGLVIADVSKKTGYRLRRETLAETAALLETYLGTEE